MIWNRKTIWLPLLFVVAIIIAAISYYCASHHPPEAINREAPERPGLAGKILAKGLCFEEHLEGEKLFTFRIGAVKILRKKVGFFSLGFFKVARLEDVQIDFYDAVRNSRSTADNLLSFKKCLLSEENLNLLRPKGVKGLEIGNISVNVHGRGILLSSIRSDRAKISFRDKEVVFEGHVRIASGDKVLECKRISWSEDITRFRTKGPYVAKVQGRQLSGNGLETGYLLEKLGLDIPRLPIRSRERIREGKNGGT